MGSHRARHRADQNNSEELATDLLARLADEVRPPSARTRHAAERPALDPFSTAPFPARTPAAADPDAPDGAQPHPAPPDGPQPGMAQPHPAQPNIPHPRTAAPDAAPPSAQLGTARPPTAPPDDPQPGGPQPDGTQEGVARPRTGAGRGRTSRPRGGQPGGPPDGAQDGTAQPSAVQPNTARAVGPQQDGAPRDGTQPGIPAPRAARRGAGRPDAAGTPESGPMVPEATEQQALGLRSGPAAELSAGYGYGSEPAGHVSAPRFPSDPAAPFPLADAPAGLLDAPRTGRERLSALGRKPIYAAVSTTMITAAVAAVAGSAAGTPPPPTPDRSPPLAAAALDLAPPAPQADAPAAVQVAGGPAVLTPGKPAAPAAAPVLGSTIAAQAAADAKAYAEAQARQAVGRPAAAPRNAPAPKPAPKPAVKQAPKPAAAAPAAGSSVGARALALAKGKVGTPYVWGAAGPSAFDCSGLIVWAYKQLGVSLPHSSATLSTMGTPVSKAALQPGDLVFFYSPVSHVGMYAGNGMVLNATQSGEPVRFSKLANLPFHNATRLTK
jgi:peptidoglycan DL-endopeptidase CwlO